MNSRLGKRRPDELHAIAESEQKPKKRKGKSRRRRSEECNEG